MRHECAACSRSAPWAIRIWAVWHARCSKCIHLLTCLLSSIYRPDQFLATREAPRPPTDRQPKVSLTPNVYMTPGNPNLKSAPTFNRSDTSLGGDNPIIKDGFAKVKEEGAGFMKQFWNERFLLQI